MNLTFKRAIAKINQKIIEAHRFINDTNPLEHQWDVFQEMDDLDSLLAHRATIIRSKNSRAGASDAPVKPKTSHRRFQNL